MYTLAWAFAMLEVAIDTDWHEYFAAKTGLGAEPMNARETMWLLAIEGHIRPCLHQTKALLGRWTI